jgi:predicted TIM-barrel fold metal-dependent hydrolase
MARPPFVDTHIHFHDFSCAGLRWDWLLPEAADPDLGDYGEIKSRRYTAEDFIGETRFQNVCAVVHVQAAVGSPDPVEETRWLEEVAARTGLPHGIVAYADLAQPDVERMLERHAEFPRLRGIRDLRYDDYLTNEAWIRGFSLLERFGLILCDDPVVEEMCLLADIVERRPGIDVCIDHAGFPRRRDDDYFREWRAGMERLARVESTVVKISGLGMVDHRWTVDSLRRWVLTCIELWGTQRAFFGTNWPVDRIFSSYGDVLDAYDEIISDFSESERQALFNGNASRIFGLDPR